MVLPEEEAENVEDIGGIAVVLDKMDHFVIKLGVVGWV